MQFNNQAELDDRVANLALQIAEEVKLYGTSPTYQEILSIDFLREPVDPETFLFDPYYMGRIGKGLYNKWVDVLLEVLDPNNGYYEFICTGAIGCGKSTVAALALAYRLYWLSCLKDPAQFFGLMHGTPLLLGVYNVFKYKADDNYGMLKVFVEQSEYFREHFPTLKMKNRSSKDGLYFDRGVYVISGSNELHALGLNLFALLLDELNFMRIPNAPGNTLSQAQKLYTACRRRLESRYMYKGTVPGLMVLISSRNVETSWLEHHISEVKGTKGVFIADYALWEVKKEVMGYSGRTFKVQVGDAFSGSRILDPGEEPAPGSKIVEVPEEHRADFERDIEGCFTVDTRVSLLDGTERTFGELMDYHGPIWVYSYDRRRGRVVPGLASRPFKTGSQVPVLKITLDNGQQVCCTYNHLWMMSDGSYKAAQLLSPGDSLMPLYRKRSKKRSGREMFRDPLTAKWLYTHHMVSEHVTRACDLVEGSLVFKPDRGREHCVRHHLNLDSSDNRPDNLVWMKYKDHRLYHSGLRRFGVEKSGPYPVWEQGTVGLVTSRFEEAKLDRHGKRFARCNHKVLSVQPAGLADVYDITVEGLHNFALSAGVFVHNSLRDLAGEATLAYSLFIRHREHVRACINPELKHPFTRESVTISNKLPAKIQDYLRWRDLVEVKMSVVKPRRNPGAARHVHVDLAKSQCSAGICMGHVSDIRGYMPRMSIDFMLRVMPPKIGEIDFSKIREFIIYLRDQLGFPIKSVSFDSYQSTDSLQILEKLGFEASVVSVDRSDEAYLAARQVIYEHRVEYYDYPPMIQELTSLIYDAEKKRVDHPSVPGASKDVSDALASVLYYFSKALGSQRSLGRVREARELLPMIGERLDYANPGRSDGGVFFTYG